MRKAKEQPPDHQLTVTLKGPATERGRIRWSDLSRVGSSIQSALERVGRVLLGEGTSAKTGRKPRQVEANFSLEVVALRPGSFQLVLDLAREQLQIPETDLGVKALEVLIEGVSELEGTKPELPHGFDPGVIAALRDLGTLLDKGVETVEFHLSTHRKHRVTTYSRSTYERIVQRIQGPISNRRTVEGRLLMADFKEPKTRCRLHPEVGDPVTCSFDESLSPTIQESLRSFVRVTGEAQTNPTTGKIEHLRIVDLQPLQGEGRLPSSAERDEFRQPKSLDELADEQGVSPLTRLEDVFGRAAGLWDSDEDLQNFLDNLHRRRREGTTA